MSNLYLASEGFVPTSWIAGANKLMYLRLSRRWAGTAFQSEMVLKS